MIYHIRKKLKPSRGNQWYKDHSCRYNGTLCNGDPTSYDQPLRSKHDVWSHPDHGKMEPCKKMHEYIGPTPNQKGETTMSKMRENKFTPGPWEYDVHVNDSGNDATIWDTVTDSTICKVSSRGRKWSKDKRKKYPDERWFTEEDVANAKLIAAAPDLLEACIELLKNYERDSKHIPAIENSPNVKHAFSIARNAICKATEKETQ